MKKLILIMLAAGFFMSCVTFEPAPPSLYIEGLPQSVVTGLTLDERILLEEAWKSLREGKAKKAERTISGLSPDNPVYYAGLGYVHFLLGDLVAAEENFTIALESSSEVLLPHLGLAQIFKKRGEDEKALSELREILKIEPQHPWAKEQYETLKTGISSDLLDTARVYLAEGDTERGKQSLLKALFYSPELIEAHLALADIYRKNKEPQNVLVHLKAASELDPDNEKLLRDYAESLSEAKQYARSLEAYERLLEKKPDDKDTQNRIGNLKNRLGIYELPSQYDSIPLRESVTKEDCAALLAVKFKGFLDEPESRPPILVDIATSWASRFIIRMAALNLLDVYENHTFQPKKMVTRAEMAEILVRLVSLLKKKGHRFIEQFPRDRIQIADVSPDNYYYQPITLALAYEIMTLSPQREFKPDQGMTGQEVIDILDVILALIQ